ncbi:3-deoxy-D-manno-octulosonic acid transferase [Aliiglaciecola sp. NS0011-25]|uniref:3-deoxy-D-manno-octulosonic acid transferase n=1 Tax=Aliiglaciecola sp. NS0011-25 TaxID=3127654 RepID=UPI003342BDF5
MTQSPSQQSSFLNSTKLVCSRWLYSLTLSLVIPILFIHWLVNFSLRKKQFNLHRLNRFSIYTKAVKGSEILIHCVSVGEVAVAASLIEKLFREDPNLNVTVTTTTPTGAANVKNLLGEKVQHLYLPFDLGWMMKRMLNKIRPKQVLVVEVELWPNMIRQCVKGQIPVILVNGRMTDRSVRGYQKMAALISPMMQSIKHVCAQSERDYRNYLSLGIPADKLTITGNIKFELENTISGAAEPLVTKFKHEKRKILIAGSTHDPEEQILVEATKSLIKQFPELLLMIVPRHPQRFDKVYELLSGSGLSVSRTSQTNKSVRHTDIVLVDQMGVLTDLYHYADFAFIGGSIAAKGGHNPLEAAVAAIPTMMGNHIHNNPAICESLKQSGNLFLVTTSQDIVDLVSHWLVDDKARISAGQKGYDVIKSNRGALQKTIELINTHRP